MMGKLTITAVLSFLPALVSLCVFMTSPVAAKTKLQPARAIVSPCHRRFIVRRRVYRNAQNRLFRESLRESQQTSMSFAERRGEFREGADQHRLDKHVPKEFHKRLQARVLF